MDTLLKGDKNSGSSALLPTLNQWLKAIKGQRIAHMYHVRVIWLPNKYASISFETEKFRLRFYENSPVYNDAVALAKRVFMNNIPLGIVVHESRDGSFEFVQCEKENVDWNQIGEYGYKQTFLDIPETKKSKKREDTKPVSTEEPQQPQIGGLDIGTV